MFSNQGVSLLVEDSAIDSWGFCSSATSLHMGSDFEIDSSVLRTDLCQNKSCLVFLSPWSFSRGFQLDCIRSMQCRPEFRATPTNTAKIEPSKHFASDQQDPGTSTCLIGQWLLVLRVPEIWDGLTCRKSLQIRVRKLPSTNATREWNLEKLEESRLSSSWNSKVQTTSTEDQGTVRKQTLVTLRTRFWSACVPHMSYTGNVDE